MRPTDPAVLAIAVLCAPGRAAVDFQTPVLNQPGTGVIAVETADVDGDGDQDVVVPDFGDISGGFVSVLRGNGDGTLAPPETYPGGQVHLALTVTDLNGDGAPDIAMPNSSFNAGTLSVLLNNGDGTYGASVDYAAGVPTPRAVAPGDVDGDGDNDLIVGDAFLQSHAVLFNDGAGAFPSATTFSGGTTTIDAKLADLDGDGDLDAVFAFSDLALHRNDGAGGFQTFSLIDTGGFAALALADFDDDGDVDIAAARSGQLDVHLNGGGGETFAVESYPIPDLARDVAAGDFDGDGRLDLVTSHVAEVNKVAVLQNVGGGAFAAAVPFTPGIYPQSVTATDLEGDGRDDVVAALEFHDPPSVAVLISASTPPADLDGDGAVGVIDLLELLASWGPCPAPPAGCPADLDGDGAVGVTDFLALLAAWG